MRQFNYKIYWSDGSTTTFSVSASAESYALKCLHLFLADDLNKVGIELLT